MKILSKYTLAFFSVFMLTPCYAGNTNELVHEASSTFQVELNPVLSNYFRLRDALVNSNPDGASLAAKAMNESLNKADLSVPEEEEQIERIVSELSEGLEQIANTKDLEEQRLYFDHVSTRFYELLKILGTAGKTVYRQYCPMALDKKGAYWLSDKKEIRNPYFGDAMLKCGRIVEELK